jgi:phosphatidylglycerol lysyltransferase
MKQYLEHLRPLIPLLMFAVAAWLLFHEVKQYHIVDLMKSVSSIPTWRIAGAIALSALDYCILAFYDVIAVRYLAYPLDTPRVALASFISYVCSHNFGSLLGGTGVRYRMYSTFGLPAVDIVKIVALVSVTFWLGLGTVAGVLFVFAPFQIPERLHMPFADTRLLGSVLLGVLATYFVLCATRRAPIQVRGWSMPFPTVGLTLKQVGIGMLDILTASSVLYVLLSGAVGVNYFHFVAIYTLAIVSGVISNVPGGLGVFELTILVLLPPGNSQQVLAALLVYRATFYLLPLIIAAALMGFNELMHHRHVLLRIVAVANQVAPMLVPRLFAFGAFTAGALLLFSGALPTGKERLHWISHVLPLAVFEMSHFSASLLGVALLPVARGLNRRLDAAYWTALVMLAVGVVLVLLRGFDYEEAVLLFVLLVAMVPCRRHFYRRGSLLRQPFAAGWAAGAALVLACAIWLGIFAHKHVEYHDYLWWQVAFRADTPRFLRASLGAISAALIFGIWKLLSGATPRPSLPTAGDLETVRAIASSSPDTYAQLALLRDKMFLFSESRNAYLMFAVEGRSWIAMGDPVGPPQEAPGLILRLRELADSYDDWAVFYQVDAERLAWYADIGFSAVKIGEEARVPLGDFSLEGGSRKPLRKILNRFERDMLQFEVLPPAAVPGLLDELGAVSDAWLESKHAREKRFSLGWFEPDYLRQCSIAVIRLEGKILAFANVLQAARVELSIDLMRYLPAAPKDIMAQLLLQLMLWGQAEGFEWFNLGMAPLSGLENHPLAPTWSRVGALIFQHGEEFYNFQGLRQFKEQFDPVWRPKYLASKGGLSLPRVLTNVAALINRRP